jgi:hypothetical protein
MYLIKLNSIKDVLSLGVLGTDGHRITLSSAIQFGKHYH